MKVCDIFGVFEARKERGTPLCEPDPLVAAILSVLSVDVPSLVNGRFCAFCGALVSDVG
jgi:hypothetical protein